MPTTTGTTQVQVWVMAWVKTSTSGSASGGVVVDGGSVVTTSSKSQVESIKCLGQVNQVDQSNWLCQVKVHFDSFAIFSESSLHLIC